LNLHFSIFWKNFLARSDRFELQLTSADGKIQIFHVKEII